MHIERNPGETMEVDWGGDTVSLWHERIANKVAADSICDRLSHGPHEIFVKGEMRKRIAQQMI